MKFFNPKNIMKNGVRVLKGTAGAIGSDFVAEKLVTKIPKLGEKPILKHLSTAVVAVMAMDVKAAEDFAFGAAVNQMTNAAYTYPAIKSFTGISDDLADDIVSEIEDNIEADIRLYKGELSGQGGNAAELSSHSGSAADLADEPTYGINEEFAY